MSVEFLTKTIEEGPPIGRVCMRPKEIEIILLDGADRSRVCNELSICRVRPLNMKGMPEPAAGRSWFQDMTAFEKEWAATHPDQYKAVRIFGAGWYSGKGGTSEEFWSALRRVFSSHEGAELTLRQIAEIYWTAIESVMPPKDFSDLAMSYR